jgi:hypothetical protein
MSYIIERPAGMPDWVEIGVKFWGSRDGVNWKGPFNLTGYGDYNIGHNNEYRDTKGNWWEYAKPYIPWTPKEGERCACWDRNDERLFMSIGFYGYSRNGKYIVSGCVWDYCARITNEDGTLIDIRCTVDELKARTDCLGPEEE